MRIIQPGISVGCIGHRARHCGRIRLVSWHLGMCPRCRVGPVTRFAESKSLAGKRQESSTGNWHVGIKSWYVGRVTRMRPKHIRRIISNLCRLSTGILVDRL